MAAKRAGNRGKGRKKGVPNKTTASVKAALIEAFDKLGGVKALVAWARTEKTEFYKLYAKLLPTEVKLDSNERRHITIVRRIVTRRDDHGGDASGAS